MGNTLERPTAPGDEFPWLFQQLRIQNHENRRLANALREENRRRRHPENRDRQPCRFYAHGFCFHGTDCRYAHDGPVTRTRQPDRRQREPCRFCSTPRVSALTAKPVAFLTKDPDLFKKHVASSPKDFVREELPADMLTISLTPSGRKSPR